MQKKITAAACLLLADIMFSSVCAGCGSKVQVHIFDSRTETRLFAEAGITVAQALEEAEIVLEKDDVVQPSLDTVVPDGGMKITIERYAEVTVTDNERTQQIGLTGAKVCDALKAAKAEVGKYDSVSHDMDAYLKDGMDITIERRCFVSIKADGELKEYVTNAGTVRALLKEQGISLGKKDQVTPKLSRKITDGMQIAVQRISEREITEYETVPYNTKTEYSSAMYQGETSQKQAGQDGQKEITYKVSYTDGKEEKRTLVSETVVKEPVSCIIVKGTAVRRQETQASGQAPEETGRRIVSREPVYDCDGSGHGYYVITWSDGEVEYEDF